MKRPQKLAVMLVPTPPYEICGLTDTEREQIEKRRAELRLTRSKALAMVLVKELDLYIGFTGAQRTSLTQLFGEPLLGLPDYYFVAQSNNSYYSIDSGLMFAQVSGAAETELPSLLDEEQLKRWQGLTRKTLSQHYYSSKGNVDDLDFPLKEEIDEIEAQRLITAYLHHRSKEYTQKGRVIMKAKADSITRAGNLAPEQTAALNTAAKGAAQALSLSNVRNFENWARQNFQNVKPADFPARLKSAGLPRFSDRSRVNDPKLKFLRPFGLNR